MSAPTCMSQTRPINSLLAEIATGDTDAMTTLWTEYAGRVRSLARSFTMVTSADAEDVVQETMAKVWRFADRFDPDRGTETTFVMTIARRIIIDRWRKVNSRPAEISSDVLPNVEPETEDVYTGLTVKSVLRDAIRNLSPLHRQVIELAYTDGLTQSEIADALEVPLGTIKTRTFNALRALRRQLNESEILA
jgi:RNA polymerase sigma-70 factor, ECF subfamily